MDMVMKKRLLDGTKSLREGRKVNGEQLLAHRIGAAAGRIAREYVKELAKKQVRAIEALRDRRFKNRN